MGNEEYKFIKEHKKEIISLVDDPGTRESITHDIPVSIEKTQSILEQYETKVLVYERKDALPDATRFLLEAAASSNFKVIHPLIESFKTDERCAGATLLTDSVSGKKFVGEHDPDIHVIKNNERPVITDIPEGPYRAALVIDEAANAPSSVLLYGAKSVFGAEKLCYLSLGMFGHVEKNIFGPMRPEHMEDIDIVFSADEFSKEMLCGVLGVPKEKVIVTGTPLLEGLRVEEAQALREKGRKTLGLPAETLVVLYSGFPSAVLEEAGGDPQLNFLTFEQALSGLISAAEAEPGKNFAFVPRTHPSAKGVEPPLISARELPKNLVVVSGDGINYDEAIYASDIISCNIASTESLLARYRGREAAVFVFPGKGQLGDLFKKSYGEEGERIIRESGRMTLIDSPEKLAEMISQYQAREALPTQPGSLKRIKEIMIAPSQAV